MTDVSKSPQRIAGMFDAIAGRYDFLNHLLSGGIDRRWRRRAIRSLQLTGGERVLDLCTGTGDLAIAAVRARPSAARVVGADFSGAGLRGWGGGGGVGWGAGGSTRASRWCRGTRRASRLPTRRWTRSRSASASATSST